MGYYADLIKEKRNAKEEKDNADSVSLRVFGKNYTVKSPNDIYGIRTEITSERAKRIKAGEDEKKVNKEFDEGNDKLKKIYELFPRDYEDKEKKEKNLAKLKSILNEKEEKGYYAKLAEEKAAKKNSSSSLHRAINLILSYLQEGWAEDKIKRELKSQHNVTDEDIRDGLIAAKRLNKHI